MSNTLPFPNRKSNRLSVYDYSKEGLYFITINTYERECLFGCIREGGMILNEAGKIADEYLKGIPSSYPQTQLHEHKVMPNHIHVIIEIVSAIHEPPVAAPPITCKDTTVTAIHESPLHASRDQRRKMLISKIAGWYKMNTAKYVNIVRNTPGTAVWQRNYHDHIIRNPQSYQRISEYIRNNPVKWKEDKFFNPDLSF